MVWPISAKESYITFQINFWNLNGKWDADLAENCWTKHWTATESSRQLSGTVMSTNEHARTFTSIARKSWLGWGRTERFEAGAWRQVVRLIHKHWFIVKTVLSFFKVVIITRRILHSSKPSKYLIKIEWRNWLLPLCLDAPLRLLMRTVVLRVIAFEKSD